MDKLHELEQRIYAVEQQLNSLPKRSEIDEIVRSALISALKELGITTKTIIMTTAGIAGALAVIIGSLKAFTAIFK